MVEFLENDSPKMRDSSLHPRLIVILSTTFPLITLLAVVMGAVHCVLRRHKRKVAVKEQPDLEKASDRPQNLRVMTDFPTPTLHDTKGFDAVPPVPPKDDEWLGIRRATS